MLLQRIQISISLLCLLSVARLDAQARGYHMELSDGTGGAIILVNDSEKVIEAFLYKGLCGTTHRSFNYDALWAPGERGWDARDPSGRPIRPQPDTVAPGQQMDANELIQKPSVGCSERGDIDAVIYSDGTFDGSEEGVRSMQVWRDGLANELQYWFARLQSKPSDIYAIANEAKQRDDSYKELRAGARPQLLVDYQLGEQQVATAVVHQIAEDPSPIALVELIDTWKKKLDSDLAFKKMSVIFPAAR